jgi:hypothetical protein
MYTFQMVEAPSQPLNLKVTEFSDSHVSLVWKQPLSTGGQPLQGFYLHRQDCSKAESSFELLSTLAANQFSFTDSTVVGGDEYKYTITCFNEIGGESIKSNQDGATPSVVPIGMDAPTEVTHDTTSVTV